ncbi:MAG: family 43 glycosylhydrolase [Prevotella sp.]|nr:family 43 glycosylhydrolase [Prevotella sp.]
MYRKAILATVAVALSVSASAETIAKNYKDSGYGNPISPCIFCADPTALVCDGRVYVYGSNDHQQFIKNGKKGNNGYGDIKSLVVFSSDDMMNWTFHGTIDVGKLCSSWGWRFAASWAPSVTWRETADGKREFFLYFANSGGSIGVLKASSPIGPWSSPLSKPMIDSDTPGVKPCNWIFDPGVVIDDNGTGWIGFGGGDPLSTGSKLMPGNSRMAKLKPSMTALDGNAVNLPAPYLFEASELNIMNGRYVYTYNTSWSDRDDWSSYEKRGGYQAPSACSMCYMVTDTPLDPDSWQYRGEYVPNEGNFGMGWGNNHTHLQKFGNKYYLFYHSTLLEQTMNTGASGFRSIGVDNCTVDESTQKIDKVTMTKTSVAPIRYLNPFNLQQAETMSTCGGVSYEDFSNITRPASISNLGNDASQNLQIKMAAGSWIMVRKANFGKQAGAAAFMLRAKGKGKMEIRFDDKSAAPVATIEFSSTAMEDHSVNLNAPSFKGVKNIYFVFTEANNVYFDAWQFLDESVNGIEDTSNDSYTVRKTVDLGGRSMTAAGQRGKIVVEQYTDGRGVRHARKRVASTQSR